MKRALGLSILGRKDRISPDIAAAIDRVVDMTRDNTGITLSVAFDYGGREDILEAARSLIRDGLTPDDVDEPQLARRLFTNGLPDPDLMIRTGGELRISNFLLWQAAYAELYFTPTLWPDFGPEEVQKALNAYANQKTPLRRSGRRLTPPRGSSANPRTLPQASNLPASPPSRIPRAPSRIPRAPLRIPRAGGGHRTASAAPPHQPIQSKVWNGKREPRLNPRLPAYTYSLASPYGTMYIGMTSNLVTRVWQHKNDFVPGFTSTHSVHDLVWYEIHETLAAAAARERALKKWNRQWKFRLILEMNPNWDDLYWDIV